MTPVLDPTTKGEPTFDAYDHVTWYVSNAKQAAAFFTTRMGFKHEATSGLETGSPDVSSQVVRAGNVRMVFMSALRVAASERRNVARVLEIHAHIRRHGDGVKDIAFKVSDVDAVYHAAVKKGATAIFKPQSVRDNFGTVRFATIAAFGDTTHTLLCRDNYSGPFFPGYVAVGLNSEPLNGILPPTGLETIDHCVGNQDWGQLEQICKFYENILGFHRFWSVDDNQICTEFSALRSTVVATPNEKVKLPMNEPAHGKGKSQIEEFVHFYDGPGVQHIALRTSDIIATISALKGRGLEFIKVPETYYSTLRERIAQSSVKIAEDLKELQMLDILVDFDDDGYLLQLFTKPIVDRPTVFLEIIQRKNFDGFGAGNFKALFEAIEREQEARGTL